MKILKDKVLITGANGLLGQKLVEAFSPDYEVHGIGRQETAKISAEHYGYSSCDISKRGQIVNFVKDLQPTIIVNAAAYTNVDGCEDDKEACWAVNALGAEYLGYAAERSGVEHLLHVSTDYVFDGSAEIYDEQSRPNPLGYYGKAKLAGENAIAGGGAPWTIARTMVLYGHGEGLRRNFATWLVEALGKGSPVRIVKDQHGHPTLADDLATAILKLVEKRQTGIFNSTGEDYVSRYDFALRLAEVFGFDKSLITPIDTSELNQKADRPLNSRFDLSKLRRAIDFVPGGVVDGLTKLKEGLTDGETSK